MLSDLTQINSLLSVARQYVITDSGWNLLDFASQMRSLTSGNLTFRTLPIVAYEIIGGQDANQVTRPTSSRSSSRPSTRRRGARRGRPGLGLVQPRARDHGGRRQDHRRRLQRR